LSGYEGRIRGGRKKEGQIVAIHPIFHASLLTPYIKTDEHSANYMRPPPDMIEGEEQYEVEAIRAH
jgi:hypothetical protein